MCILIRGTQEETGGRGKVDVMTEIESGMIHFVDGGMGQKEYRQLGTRG